MAIENKKYRDTVFRMLFNKKEHLLELYNALNGTSYTNPNDLTITTLKGNTYLDMRNDVSFILDFELNPNHECMQYFERLFPFCLKSEKIYS